MKSLRLPEGRVWLRVADPEWTNPLDPSHAATHGGRWNAPGSFSVLYLNADVVTARSQIDRMLDTTAVRPDDLEDDAYLLIPVQLPRRQRVADAVSDEGVSSLGLPAEYPRGEDGETVPHAPCQAIGAGIHEARLRGVWCRSAATQSGTGRELAWFPASSRSVARPLHQKPLLFGVWRNAFSWADLELEAQPDPESSNQR